MYPENWKFSKLEDAVEKIIDYRGKTPKKTNFGIPLITAKIVKDGFIQEPQEFIGYDDYDVWMVRGLPQKGDVILTMEAPLGEVAQITNERVALAQRLVAIRGHKEILDNTYLKYFFISNLGQSVLKQRETGTTVTGIKQSELRKIVIPLPPLPEQRAIADVLSALDDKIELNRRINHTLEQLARALFKHMFIDNQERAGWEEAPLGDDFQLTMGQSPPGSTYNEIGEGMPFFQGRADYGFRYPTNRVYCTAPTRFANAGDTLVSVRAPVGDINMAMENCAIGRGVAAIRHKSDSRSFTYYQMLNIQNDFKNFEMEGTVFGSINKDSFHNLKYSRPPFNLILDFEKNCSPIDQQIEINIKQNKTLAELRDTLLPRLMSGQVRVKPIVTTALDANTDERLIEVNDEA
jgi:type I restriction enzyme S subunit